jgi:hypothetical protein
VPIAVGGIDVSKDDSMWADKGATLSDKSARQGFGLTQEELFAAMRAGKLQFRECSIVCTETLGFGGCGTKSNPSCEIRAG